MSDSHELFRPNPAIRILKKGFEPEEATRPLVQEPLIVGAEYLPMSNPECLEALGVKCYDFDIGESCFAQYMHYLHGYSGNIADDVHAVLNSNPTIAPLMRSVARYKEMVSVGSLLLYGQANEPVDDENSTQAHKHRLWYKDTIDHCAQALEQSSRFAEALKTSTQDADFHHFIDDFQQEIELLIADTVNLATGTAAHLTREDCAVFIGELPVKVPEKANFGNIFSLFGEHSGKGLTVYDRFLGGSLDYLRSQKKDLDEGKTDRTIRFPALVSAFDTEEFARLLNEFFTEAYQGLSAASYDTTTDTFTLGEEIELSIKPHGSQKAQPRINFKGIERFKGFSLRIDKEDSRVAMDIGGYGYATLIKIGEAIAKATQNGESIMDYPDLAQDSDYRISSRVLYKPVNRNPAIPKISQGEFMAYVGAFCMSISHQMGIRRSSSYFSYHSRSFLATDPDHHTHFASNAATLYTIMLSLSDEQRI